MTDRHTNASSGRVVSMFKPKHLAKVSPAMSQYIKARRLYSRAILIRMLSDGKLLSTLPWVCEPKNRNPETPMARQVRRETAVE